MEHRGGKTLYLVSSLFILFAYKEIASHSSRKERWQWGVSVFRGKGKGGQAWHWKVCMTTHGLWGANTSPRCSFSYPFLTQMHRKDYESSLWKHAPLQHYRTGINFNSQISGSSLFLLISGLFFFLYVCLCEHFWRWCVCVCLFFGFVGIFLLAFFCTRRLFLISPGNEALEDFLKIL